MKLREILDLYGFAVIDSRLAPDPPRQGPTQALLLDA